MSEKTCAVIGVGPGNGFAFAKRFSEGGYKVALLSRDLSKLRSYESEIPNSRSISCDASDPNAVTLALTTIAREMGPIDTLLYNAGSGHWNTPEETTINAMEQSWKVNTLGLLAASQAVIPAMKKKGEGSIIVTGATASLRGGAKTTDFASAKAAQRSLAQSLARHLGPMGIHVALMILDGIIDMERTRKAMADKNDDFFLKAADIAETVWHVAHQPKSAWTFEYDLRPFGEKW